MPLPELSVVEIKAFVPARDFELSKAFYLALGFDVPWSSDDLARIQFGTARFLLQKCYAQGHAENFMMSLQVENVDG